jgi:hypothetical protein
MDLETSIQLCRNYCVLTSIHCLLAITRLRWVYDVSSIHKNLHLRHCLFAAAAKSWRRGLGDTCHRPSPCSQMNNMCGHFHYLSAIITG